MAICEITFDVYQVPVMLCSIFSLNAAGPYMFYEDTHSTLNDRGDRTVLTQAQVQCT